MEVQRAPDPASLTIEATGIADLSGITWVEGNVFAAVSDKRNVIQYLTLQINRGTGELTGGEFGKVVELKGTPNDLEGIAWVASEKAFYLASEKLRALLRAPAGGTSASRIAAPSIFAGARPNLGLESLTWSSAAQQFWIANEEALKGDGPLSSAEAGTLVRLQKLNAKCRPLAQFAWRTEPASFRYGGAGSGVSDLCLLPNGQLIVLERGFGISGLQLRLFLADFRGATEVTKLPALGAAGVVPAKKRLLFEEATGFTNFEGLTLGPALADGWWSLILVADSNGTSTHSFRVLKVREAGKKQ